MSGIASWKAKIEIDIKDLQRQLIDADEKIDKFANEDRKVKLDIDTKTLESAIQKLDKMLDSLGKGTGDFKQFENLSKELSSIVSEVQSLSKAFGKVDDSGAKTLLSSIQNIDKSLSELSQNILNVNKNMSNMGGNTSGVVKQVENITNESKKAASALEDVAKAQAKVNGQKTNISSGMKDAFPDKDISASVESATNSIKEENNALEQNTQKVKENTQAKEQNANVNLNKYDKRLDSYQSKSDKYDAALTKLQNNGWASPSYSKNVEQLKQTIDDYKNALNGLKSKPDLVTEKDLNNLNELEAKIKDAIAAITNMSAAEKGFDKTKAEKMLKNINAILEKNSKMSSDAKKKIQAYYDEIASGNPSKNLNVIYGEILKIVNAEEQAGRSGKRFLDIFSSSRIHQIASQMAGMFSFYDLINGVKGGINVVRELNTALTEMRKVSDETVQSLKNYQNTTFDVADAVGTTAKQIQASTADYMRLGESLDEAAESARTANVLLNVSEFDNIEDATKSLVAMGQAYKDLDKMTIVDKLNEIGNNYSISTDELASALQRSAATLSLMGNTIDEAASLVTTANATIQDADSVSAGLRTISLRLVGKIIMPKYTVMYRNFIPVSNYIG